MIAWNVIRLASVVSTMDEIDLLGEAGAPGGTIVVADEQTGGRGRAGRPWTAPSGSGLFVSILHRPELKVGRASSLPLVVGIAVAEEIESAAGAACQLKWPNDVLIDGGKAAGILVSTRLAGDAVRFVNVGIGVNCTSTRAELPPGAASLRSATGKLVRPQEFLPALLGRLEHWFEQFELEEGRPSLAGWWVRAAFRDEPVQLVDHGAPIQGTLTGVDADGALILSDERGRRVRVVSGDLTRGPRRVVAL